MQIRPHIEKDGKLVPISYKELARLRADDPNLEVVRKLCNVPKDGIRWEWLEDIMDVLRDNYLNDRPSLFKNEAQRQRILDAYDHFRTFIERG